MFRAIVIDFERSFGSWAHFDKRHLGMGFGQRDGLSDPILRVSLSGDLPPPDADPANVSRVVDVSRCPEQQVDGRLAPKLWHSHSPPIISVAIVGVAGVIFVVVSVLSLVPVIVAMVNPVLNSDNNLQMPMAVLSSQAKEQEVTFERHFASRPMVWNGRWKTQTQTKPQTQVQRRDRDFGWWRFSECIPPLASRESVAAAAVIEACREVVDCTTRKIVLDEVEPHRVASQ
ncbi:hypothetical protein CCHR01_10100 [Colletotrichum chrysophilum]|uniref:Uncharacterized protein n=1 Tax=Colletotrichum chrysophilum TaxID=1836956 RepID=A0AAD9EH28_9PEZI|nr:hypothetical protein CCHR01_10100 [Colletotrichum chrysophilum]